MDLDAWLTEHIGCEQRRADVRANVDCLSDFRVASLEDLEDALGLAAWPALPKKRFLDAWRRLKEGEDEAAPSSEPQRPRSAPVSAAELAAAARAHGLKIGAYVCPSLWNNDDYWAPDALTSLSGHIHGPCAPTYHTDDDPVRWNRSSGGD